MFNDVANFKLFLSLIRFKWTSFGLYAIASVMSVSLRLKGLTLREEFFAASIGMGILITGATALLLILGFWVIRPIRVRWHWVVIPMLLLAGGVRGAILYLEIDGFG
jgi:K+ transporter